MARREGLTFDMVKAQLDRCFGPERAQDVIDLIVDESDRIRLEELRAIRDGIVDQYIEYRNAAGASALSVDRWMNRENIFETIDYAALTYLEGNLPDYFFEGAQDDLVWTIQQLVEQRDSGV